jgi:hypothetical protein
MIRLIGNFEVVEAKVDTVGTLVGLAARMVDSTDEALLIRFLSTQVEGFPEQMKYYRQMLDQIVSESRCSQDGATVAKAQEISRIYSVAVSLVQSVAKKIAPRPPR